MLVISFVKRKEQNLNWRLDMERSGLKTGWILTGNKEVDRRRLKTIIAAAGMNMAQVARELGITQPAVARVVNRLENSQRIISYIESLAESVQIFKISKSA
jgi:transcriptional regulator with GAF, ATPase, and Fis domain